MGPVNLENITNIHAYLEDDCRVHPYQAHHLAGLIGNIPKMVYIGFFIKSKGDIMEDTTQDNEELDVLTSIDKPIRDLIININRIGIQTIFSCCGFSYKDEGDKNHCVTSYVLFEDPNKDTLENFLQFVDRYLFIGDNRLYNPNLLYREFYAAITIGDLNTARQLRDKVYNLYLNGQSELYETYLDMQEKFVRLRSQGCEPAGICQTLRN
jgi:hypothetical protein